MAVEPLSKIIATHSITIYTVKKLKILFQVVDKGSEEFDTVKKYVKNTHAATHNQYDLELLDVCIFKHAI